VGISNVLRNVETCAGSLIAGNVLSRRPDLFAAALFRRPFVNLLETMTDESLPLTVHEYAEWGRPADPGVLEHLAALCPHQTLQPARCAYHRLAT
jgi:oligopeptidase B